MSTSEPASEHAGQGASIPTANAPQPRGGSVASGLHTFGLLAFLAVWAYFGRVRPTICERNSLQIICFFMRRCSRWNGSYSPISCVASEARSISQRIGRPAVDQGKSSIHRRCNCRRVRGGRADSYRRGPILTARDSNIQTLQFMMPVGVSEMVMWVLLSLTAGVCEETIFRGYFQRQFMAWTGNAAAGVAISAAMFGACHIYQGGKQTIVIAVYGAMFGTLAVFRRSLKPGIMAHAFQDTSAGMVLSLAIKYKLGGM